jgi:hypothetical protein
MRRFLIPGRLFSTYPAVKTTILERKASLLIGKLLQEKQYSKA